MNNTIEILDKDTNTKQTYVLKEKQETQNKKSVLSVTWEIVKFILNILAIFVKWSIQFSFYIITFLLELLVKIIRAVFLEEYEPFGFITDILLEDKTQQRIDEYERRFSTENLTKHFYKFERSTLYTNTYKKIQGKLKEFADNNVAINQEVYKDVLDAIDVLTVEVEKKALQEGYAYASFTKYRLSDEEEIYNNFIEYKIMRGEGHDKTYKEYGEDKN